MFVYYITDRRQLSSDHEESLRLLLERISEAVNVGVDAIQLREKDLSARELVDLGRRCVELVQGAHSLQTSPARTRLLINSRLDVAIAAGADGVHLRSDDVSAADARAIFSQAGVCSALIAVSCHTVQDVSLAEGQGANFAVFGPVFGKASEETALRGLTDLKAACRGRRAAAHPMPVLALGGVTPHNALGCLKAGVQGIAGIRLFQSGNLVETLSQLRKLAEDLPC